jgi:hypothetical protein
VKLFDTLSCCFGILAIVSCAPAGAAPPTDGSRPLESVPDAASNRALDESRSEPLIVSSVSVVDQRIALEATAPDPAWQATNAQLRRSFGGATTSLAARARGSLWIRLRCETGGLAPVLLDTDVRSLDARFGDVMPDRATPTVIPTRIGLPKDRGPCEVGVRLRADGVEDRESVFCLPTAMDSRATEGPCAAFSGDAPEGRFVVSELRDARVYGPGVKPDVTAHFQLVLITGRAWADERIHVSMSCDARVRNNAIRWRGAEKSPVPAPLWTTPGDVLRTSIRVVLDTDARDRALPSSCDVRVETTEASGERTLHKVFCLRPRAVSLELDPLCSIEPGPCASP